MCGACPGCMRYLEAWKKLYHHAPAIRIGSRGVESLDDDRHYTTLPSLIVEPRRVLDLSKLGSVAKIVKQEEEEDEEEEEVQVEEEEEEEEDSDFEAFLNDMYEEDDEQEEQVEIPEDIELDDDVEEDAPKRKRKKRRNV